MRTTEKGDRFRDQVAALLTASGYNVTVELLKGHKRGDLFFEQTSFGTKRRYAVEAKNWTKRLDKGDLEAILGGYISLMQSGTIDELIVVSPHALTSPQAKAFVAQTAGITHQSFNEFQESILGFHEFLHASVSRYARLGVENYYVPPRINEAETLDAHIDAWADNDDFRPIAILASYGMGKTTFAEHVANRFARRFLAGEVVRVPLIVKLGAISREQSLEGLIGSILTGEAPAVRHYSFPLFYHLNSIGRFLVLLDGFDEMKHMITRAEFEANFDELNRLVSGRAKVILLGRPNAFLSEGEQNYVLRGIRQVGQKAVQALGAPSYRELRLAPFTPEQVQQFFVAYFRFHMEVGNIQAGEDFLEKRKRELGSRDLQELISRPVHAQMLADLASDPTFEIRGLTRFALYDHFFDHLIRREIKKPNRGPTLKPDDRRMFACDLAWLLWTGEGLSPGCRLDELPAKLFEPYLPADEDPYAVRRALLSASFLDEKSAGVFFFSHRSFQEFLVAEYIWSNVSDEAFGLNAGQTLSRYLTEDVFGFLVERDDAEFFKEFLQLLSVAHVSVPISTFRTLARPAIIYDAARAKSAQTFSSWDAAILLGRIEANPARNTTIAKAIIERASHNPSVLLSAAKMLVILAQEASLPFDVVARAAVALLFARADTDIEALARQQYRGDRANPLREFLYDAVTARMSSTGELTLRLDIHRFFDGTRRFLEQPIQFGENLSANAAFEAPFDVFFGGFSADLKMLLHEHYKRDAAAAAAPDPDPDPADS